MLVVFSGLDGAGKSTQIDLLLTRLRQQGSDPAWIWTRGGYTPLFNAFKRVLRRLSPVPVLPKPGPSRRRSRMLANPKTRRVWLSLAMLDLLFVYGVRIRWWLQRGRPVICDRYLWDTWIDFRLNFPQERIDGWLLWRLLRKITPQPDITFLLLIPVSESRHRSQLKQEPFPSSAEELAQRLQVYELLAQAGQWQVLDGQRPVDDLAVEVLAGVQAKRAVAGRHNP